METVVEVKKLIFIFFILTARPGLAQIWQELFDTPGLTEDTDATAWSSIWPTGGTAPVYCNTRHDAMYPYFDYSYFAFSNTGGEGAWISEPIDIKSAAEVVVEINWGAWWTNSSDYMRAYYKINGGKEILFGEIRGRSGLTIISAASAIVSGNTVQVIIRGKENTYGLDPYNYRERMIGVLDVTIAPLTYIYSIGNGNWDNPALWSIKNHSGNSCNCTPNGNTHAFIAHEIDLRANSQTAGLTIDKGILTYEDTANLTIVRGGVLDIKKNSILTDNSLSTLTFTTYSNNIIVEGDLIVDDLIINGAKVTFSGGKTSQVTVKNDLVISNVTGKSIDANISGTFNVNDLVLSSNSFDFNNTGNLNVVANVHFNNDHILLSNSGNMEVGAAVGNNSSNRTGNLINNSDNLKVRHINANNGQLTLNNSGTIDQTGNISNFGINGAIYNLSGAVWNYDGTVATTRLYASAPDNVFNYRRGGNQTVSVPADGAYHHLTISGSGAKTLADATDVNGNLSIDGSARLDVSTSNYQLNVGGSWQVTSSNGDPFVQRSGTVVFDGSSDQILSSPAGLETFNRLTINKSGGNVLLSPGTGLTANSLTLTNGGLNLNGNNLNILGSSPAAISRANGFIVSETNASPYSRINWLAGTGTGAYVFPFGKSRAAADYVPLAVNITAAGSGAGTISVATYGTADENMPYPAGVTVIQDAIKTVNRFWQIDMNGYSVNPVATLTFSATAPEVGTNTALVAQRWNGASWDAPIRGQINPDLRSVTVPGVSQFSPWLVADGSVALPVDLVYFRANMLNDQTVLEWQTVSEKDNDYFTVERTRDFRTYSEVGKLEGSGNSESAQNYRIIDNHPFSGISYYRLKQTDINGEFKYFKPVSVTRNEVPGIIYPNPSNGRELHIRLGGMMPNDPIFIFNATGRLIFGGSLSTGQGTDIQKLTFEDALVPGIYLIRIGQDFQQRFLVH